MPMKEEKDGKDPPFNNDFVIRDGFPALRLPGGVGPWIEGDEPLPRQPFWAQESALKFSRLEQLRADCETVFSARTREDDQAYSAGITYFCPSQMKPRCALEALVLDIFHQHTESLTDGVFVPEQSGAEWWTLVLDEDDDERSKIDNGKNGENAIGVEEDEESDEVGMHFDADYGLEDQAPNLLLHPRLATVTYLSNYGAPTVVLNRRSPPPDDEGKRTLQGEVNMCWVSHPRVGKHVAFDGRLLHGAPATFFPGRELTKDLDTQQPPPTKRLKQEMEPHIRYTLLVNVWLNHCPLDAELLDEENLKKLVTPWERKKNDASGASSYSWKNLTPMKRDSDACTCVSLSASESDPAGEEEVIICGRLVTVSYGATMEELHKASGAATLVQLGLGTGVLKLEVGDKVHEDNEEGQEES